MSKQLRLPTRGMVGNGLRVVMGAVAAFDGNLTVTTRGRRKRLAVDRETGLTVVTEDAAVPPLDGMTVFISLPGDSHGYGSLATETVRLAQFGRSYKGPTSPHWYAARDLRDLMQQAPEGTTVADVADWFGIGLLRFVPCHLGRRESCPQIWGRLGFKVSAPTIDKASRKKGSLPKIRTMMMRKTASPG